MDTSAAASRASVVEGTLGVRQRTNPAGAQAPLDKRLLPLPALQPTTVESPYLEVVVPALDEEARLVPSLRRIAEYLADQDYVGAIAVVDNGSTDRTAEFAMSCADLGVPLRLIGCAKRGKGAAVRRGVLTSTADYVGFSDADLATPIDTLDTILPALETGSRVVIASRHSPGAEYAMRQPLKRRLAGQAFRLALLACTSRVTSVHDTQCGFKFFEAEAARSLFSASSATGWVFDVEILALAEMAGYDVKEVPVLWEHHEGSKLSVSRDANEVLFELVSVRRNLNMLSQSDRRLRVTVS